MNFIVIKKNCKTRSKNLDKREIVLNARILFFFRVRKREKESKI